MAFYNENKENIDWGIN